MAHSFKETAHLNTDTKKYGDNYDKIFGKKKGDVIVPKSEDSPEMKLIKQIAWDLEHLTDRETILQYVQEAIHGK